MATEKASLLLLALLTLHWTLVPGYANDGCSGFRHLENGRTFFRYGGLYVTFSCNPGFRIHGYRTSSCVSGQWAREPPLCVASGCPNPGEIQHGSKVVSPDASVVRFTCDSSFRLFGSALLYCKGKRWNGSMPVCKEADIMRSLQLKQTSLYKPSLVLNSNILPGLKNHFKSIPNTASKEIFLRPPPLGVNLPFLSEDVPKVLLKPMEDKTSKYHWSDKVTTRVIGVNVRLKETVSRLNIVRKPALTVDLSQPLPVTKLLDTTTVSAKHLTSAPLLLKPTRSTVLITSAVNDHEAQEPFRLMNQMFSTSINGEDEEENHDDSVEHRENKDVVMPLHVSWKKNHNIVPDKANSLVTQVNISSPSNRTYGDTSKRSELVRDLSDNIRKSPPTEDETKPLAVSLEGSGSNLALLENEPLSSKTSHKHFKVGCALFTGAVIHKGKPPLERSSANVTDEDLFPRTEVVTAANKLALALHLTGSPDVKSRGSFLQPLAKSNKHTVQVNVGKDSIDSDRQSLGSINEGLNDISRLDRIRSANSHRLNLAPKNWTSVISNPGQENGTKKETVVKLTLNSTARHNVSLSSSDIGEVLHVKLRPICPYPPLPAHGTFYFRTIVNPAPFQYKHYVQYACYPGYTLANGDVYSYCLQEGQWSGITPMCIEETPCSLNNGGCSQMCQVNEQNRTKCQCKAGFVLLEDQRTCRDLDECVEGLHQCQQVCENTFGSYRCSCSTGFQLSSDRMSCTDTDEYEEMEQKQQHRCEWKCVKLPGTHHCVCPREYTQHPEGHHCMDINECALKNGGCSHICMNHKGGYKSTCPQNVHISPYMFIISLVSLTFRINNTSASS